MKMPEFWLYITADCKVNVFKLLEINWIVSTCFTTYTYISCFIIIIYVEKDRNLDSAFNVALIDMSFILNETFMIYDVIGIKFGTSYEIFIYIIENYKKITYMGAIFSKTI